MKLLVVDFDPEIYAIISGFLKELGLEATTTVVGATSLDEVIDVLGNQMVSAIFCSNNIPGVADLLSLRWSQFKFPIVSIVDSADGCLEIQDFNPVAYLKKPLEISLFATVFNKMERQFLLRDSYWKSGDAFFVKEKGIIERIDLTDVLFIEAQGNYCSFQTQSSQSFLKAFSLQNLQPLLPNGFKRVHRSFIVNLNFIKKVEMQTIYLAGGAKVPVGKSYRQMLNWALGCAS